MPFPNDASRPPWFPPDGSVLRFSWPTTPLFDPDAELAGLFVDASGWDDIKKLGQSGFDITFGFQWHVQHVGCTYDTKTEVVTANNVGTGKAITQTELQYDSTLEIDGGDEVDMAIDFSTATPLQGPPSPLHFLRGDTGDFNGSASTIRSQTLPSTWKNFEDETRTDSTLTVCSGGGTFLGPGGAIGDQHWGLSLNVPSPTFHFRIAKDKATGKFKFALYSGSCFTSFSGGNFFNISSACAYFIYTGAWDPSLSIWSGQPAIYAANPDYSEEDEEIIGSIFGIDIKLKQFSFEHDWAFDQAGTHVACADAFGTTNTPYIHRVGTTSHFIDGLYLNVVPV